MRPRVATFSLLFAWICANGAIWDAAQVFAWGKMFADYAQTMDMTAALNATFDPAKPCEMCVGVANARETARQQLPTAVERAAEKLLLAMQPAEAVILDVPATSWPPAVATLAATRDRTVPVPPPRA